MEPVRWEDKVFISDMLDFNSDMLDVSSCVLILDVRWLLLLDEDDLSLDDIEWCITYETLER